MFNMLLSSFCVVCFIDSLCEHDTYNIMMKIAKMPTNPILIFDFMLIILWLNKFCLYCKTGVWLLIATVIGKLFADAPTGIGISTTPEKYGRSVTVLHTSNTSK